MKSPQRAIHARPFTAARKKPRSRPEAAAELVRLEYERDRLERDLAMITQRKNQVEERLATLSQRAQSLNESLS